MLPEQILNAFKTPHVNRKPFRGLLTYVDVCSDRPPSGSSGTGVFITCTAAERCLHTLIGMGISYGIDRHSPKCKLGVITNANIQHSLYGKGLEVIVEGYIFARDFSEETEDIEKNVTNLGMSYEIANVRVVDVKAPIWIVTDFVFTGAAILKKNLGAYSNTWIKLEG